MFAVYRRKLNWSHAMRKSSLSIFSFDFRARFLSSVMISISINIQWTPRKPNQQLSASDIYGIIISEKGKKLINNEFAMVQKKSANFCKQRRRWFGLLIATEHFIGNLIVKFLFFQNATYSERKKSNLSVHHPRSSLQKKDELFAIQSARIE